MKAPSKKELEQQIVLLERRIDSLERMVNAIRISQHQERVKETPDWWFPCPYPKIFA